MYYFTLALLIQREVGNHRSEALMTHTEHAVDTEGGRDTNFCKLHHTTTAVR